MPALRQNPLLRARVSEDGTRILWRGVDGKRWETIKKFLADQEVDITIQKHQKKRSGRQNRYYWKVIVGTLQEAVGYTTKDEAHDALRWHLLRVHEEGRPDTVRSTKDLTTVECEEYYERCRQVIAEWCGEYVPLPNEVIEGELAQDEPPEAH